MCFVQPNGFVNVRVGADTGGHAVINSPDDTVERPDAGEFEWHHIAVTLDRTSPTPSLLLYVDGMSVGSVADGAVDQLVTGNISPSQDLWLGFANVHGADGSLDDVAFFDQALSEQEVLALYNGGAQPLDFLERVKLLVNTETGQVSLTSANAAGSNAVAFDYYEIASATGSLNVANWNSLESQNLSEFPAGDGTGNGWETAGGSTDELLGEVFLDGSSEATQSTAVNLGNLFRTGGAEDLVFTFRDAQTGLYKQGIVEYITGGLLGDYNGDGAVDAADYTVWRNSLGAEVAAGTGADGNSNGTVDAGDYTIWKDNFGSSSSSLLASSTAVPEPTGLVLVLGAVAAAAGWRYRRCWSGRGLLAGTILASCCSPSLAEYTLDRLYTFGDDSAENGMAGQDIGTNTNGFTYDSIGDITGQGQPRVFIDLRAHGDIEYSSTVAPGTDPGTVSAVFDGIDDYLSGPRLGYPVTSASSTEATLDEDVTAPGPLDYTGIFNRGFQLWVRPSVVTGAAQTVVRDTAQHGLAISETGNWVMRYNNTLYESAAEATANEWTHVMVVRPSFEQGARMYVNGEAVAVATGGYLPGDNSPLVVGADLDSEELPIELFTGVVDEMELFIFGTSTDDRERYGTFNVGADNGYIQSQLTGPVGDITMDGSFDSEDVDLFVTNWLSEQVIGGMAIGDLNSYQMGDLDFNGVVDLTDAALINQAMGQAGLGSIFAHLGGGQQVPEPSTLLLAMAGCVGLGLWRRRFR